MMTQGAKRKRNPMTMNCTLALKVAHMPARTKGPLAADDDLSALSYSLLPPPPSSMSLLLSTSRIQGALLAIHSHLLR